MQTSTSSHLASRSPDDFDRWAEVIRKHVAHKKGPFFYVVPTVPLFDTYLDAFDTPAMRQLHKCTCCRHFMERFGNVVTIEGGEVVPLFWNAAGVPADYAQVQAVLWAAVQRAPLGGVFLSSDAEWGDGPAAPKMWTHFQVKNPAVFRGTILLNASQAMALKLEEKGMLERAIAEYPLKVVEQVVAILNTDQLYRSEKVAGVADWLLGLQRSLAQNKNWKRHATIVWQAVATAPVGFAHVRSSMIGTLLEDLKSGLAFDDVKKRFDAKMHPLQYRRPTAAPSDGQIAQAEKVIAALRTSGSLDRRFAKVEDLVTLWKPLPVQAKIEKAGVFGHLRSQVAEGPIATGAPATTITWEKFVRTVLPTAEKIEAQISAYKSNFVTFVTAANMDSPPIVQWDREDRRNPVTWYQYVGGSLPSNWNLTPGFRNVTAISLSPPQWDTERPMMEHQGKMAVLILDGAKDMQHTSGGGLFIELLKSEYNAIRHTLEAHIKSCKIAGRDESTASGLIYAGATVRVTAGGFQTLYKLDRWD